jgi:hypothetical protein
MNGIRPGWSSTGESGNLVANICIGGRKMAKPAGVGLAEAIATVRSELAKALDEGKGKGVRFSTDSVEIELEVAFTSGGDLGGGVHLGVVEFGAKGTVERATTHRITLSLNPQSSNGGPLALSDVGPD